MISGQTEAPRPADALQESQSIALARLVAIMARLRDPEHGCEWDRVQSFAQYGLEDGRIVDVNTRKTIVVGEDTSLLRQLFRGIGSSSAGPMLGRKL